jgi:hypothetical protein
MEIMVDSNIIVSAILFPNSVVETVFNFILDCPAHAELAEFEVIV